MTNISIITVNYKQTQVTIEFLECLQKTTSKYSFEVLLVDSEADKANRDLFSNAFPDLQYIPLNENVGFGAANNIAAAKAKGTYLLFLNNDLVFEPNFLDNMLMHIDKVESFGVVSPLIYYYDQPTQLQYAGYTEINKVTGRNEIITDRSTQAFTKTAYAHGAAMLIEAKNFKRIEGFIEDYFLYYEEIDLAARLAKESLQCYVNQDASVLHKVSMSTGKGSPLKTYFLTRNRIVFMKRNFNKLQFSVFILSFFLLSFPKNALGYLLKDRKKMKSFMNACRDGMAFNLGKRAEAWS